jgi:hypothetical protein
MPTKFDEMYDASKDDKKAARKPLVMNSLKRNLASAYDDAEQQKLEAQNRIHDARENYKSYDINEILEAKRLLKRCAELQEAIKGEYEELFGTSMTNVE